MHIKYGRQIMPDTEADRIMRKRHRELKKQNKRAEDEAERQASIRSQQYYNEIHAEIEIVLNLLAELKYPLGELIRYRVEYDFIFFPLFNHNVTKAGWKIGTHSYEAYGSNMTTPIYLLSDRRFFHSTFYGYSIGFPEEII